MKYFQIIFTSVVIAVPQKQVNGSFSQNGVLNKSSTKLNTSGKYLSQTLNGDINGFNNRGQIAAKNSITPGGIEYTSGSLNVKGADNIGTIKNTSSVGALGTSSTTLAGQAVGLNNNLKLKSTKVLGVGAVGSSNLLASAAGQNNILKTKANTQLSDGAVSVNNMLTDLGSKNLGISESNQTGGQGTTKVANFVDNLTGKSLKINTANQDNCASGTCTINGIAQLSGGRNTLINGFNNGGQGTINSAIADQQAFDSTVVQFVPGAQPGASVDANGNSVVTVGRALDLKNNPIADLNRFY